ncbi:intraflagellar transport protein 20 homolog [Zootermopsis nevadensis]|uniref:Intraflagellar transport protein 20-like protein n=1 Tax=Zootermopsis nevadensis TaxID=136037 RepID=A0A067RA83_ZOONE|nr:intraflagellar transport protein 20 homolog [Zootermopsis nevadensis]KDR15474.1 Intraflagellar transport protein 20-like protein [Zootermopsis nevadensis]
MADDLQKAGLYFDELSKIRVLEPDVAQETNKLKEECRDFVEKITDFQKIADGFILMTASLAKEVEKEKLKAIGARNLLKSVAKQREAEQQQLQALITEKSMELERLEIQYHSLQKTEEEQRQIIEHLVLHR